MSKSPGEWRISREIRRSRAKVEKSRVLASEIEVVRSRIEESARVYLRWSSASREGEVQDLRRMSIRSSARRKGCSPEVCRMSIRSSANRKGIVKKCEE